MSINTEYLNRYIDTLRADWEELRQREPGDVLYDIYRAAFAKEFEPVLEQSGQLVGLEEALRLSTPPLLVEEQRGAVLRALESGDER